MKRNAFLILTMLALIGCNEKTDERNLLSAANKIAAQPEQPNSTGDCDPTGMIAFSGVFYATGNNQFTPTIKFSTDWEGGPCTILSVGGYIQYSVQGAAFPTHYPVYYYIYQPPQGNQNGTLYVYFAQPVVSTANPAVDGVLHSDWYSISVTALWGSSCCSHTMMLQGNNADWIW